MKIPMLNAPSSADRALAQRIERADAEQIAAMVPDREPFALEPAAGGFCVFAGVGSPMTHAVGIGMQGAVTAEELDRIEEFYRSRRSACIIDLSPLADAGLISLLQNRPYRVTEFNNLVARTIAPEEPRAAPRMRRIREGEAELWSRVVSAGFAGTDDYATAALELADIAPPYSYLAELDGRPVGGAAMSMRHGVAWMFGDSTLPSARNRGLQSEMIAVRLNQAAVDGCDLAVATVLPGSGSHRNYARAGFSLLYMRVVLTRDCADTAR
jgi:hypothetical protein